MPPAANLHERSARAHVVVLGNEKGGSGKTTLAMHVVVSLLRAGFRVATVDLDMRQRSFSRYIHNRVDWQRRLLRHGAGSQLSVPDHYEFAASSADLRSRMRDEDYEALATALATIEADHDFVVIDTPGTDHHLMRLAHSMADTLVTPLNDSFVDFDVLGHVDADTGRLREVSHYAQTVRAARRRRRELEEGGFDWIVVRNRMAHLDTRNRAALASALDQLAGEIGFRSAPGVSERVIFREYFLKGLTALDGDVTGTAETASHRAARAEIEALLHALQLPVDDAVRRRADRRRRVVAPGDLIPDIELNDIFAD